MNILYCQSFNVQLQGQTYGYRTNNISCKILAIILWIMVKLEDQIFPYYVRINILRRSIVWFCWLCTIFTNEWLGGITSISDWQILHWWLVKGIIIKSIFSYQIPQIYMKIKASNCSDVHALMIINFKMKFEHLSYYGVVLYIILKYVYIR